MVSDLGTILEGWEYEPGKISVRKIIGRDGLIKIQTRIDLGVLQLESVGRPDGQRPHGFGSLLEYHEHRLREHVRRRGSAAGFELAPAACQELRREAYLYYQRYLSLFVLEEFAGVRRDTARNLRLIDLVERYAARGRDRRTFRSQRPYVLMMNVRARAYQALGRAAYQQALAIVEAGLERVRRCATDEHQPQAGRQLPEVQLLAALRAEVIRRTPADHPLRLRLALEAAVVREEYERAARLRDRLAAAGQAPAAPQRPAAPRGGPPGA